jgi:C4-dicarboxylate transporter DctQ subunit
VLLLGALVALAPLQLLLRNAFDAGIPWLDPLLRALVLWLGLLGALVASRGDRHIHVDLLARLLPPRSRMAAAVATSLFAAVVAGFLAWHGGRFVGSELALGSHAFGAVPAAAVESVIPLAFAGMALRHARHALTKARTLLGSRGGPA